MEFIKDILSEIGGEYTKLANDIIENEEFVDTGSYMLNALISGDLYGGVSSNKITAFFGLSGTGKCARGSEKITIYANEDVINDIKTRLKLN